MARTDLTTALLILVLASGPAVAGPRAPSAGADGAPAREAISQGAGPRGTAPRGTAPSGTAPRQSPFGALDGTAAWRRAASTGERDDRDGRRSEGRDGDADDGDGSAPGKAGPVPGWTMPMLDRRLGPAERAAGLSPALLEAIVRIEGLYDPTRIDVTGLRLASRIRPGTASMNNVFADRWHFGDLDANVSYRVHYIAEAWHMPPDPPCAAFDRHRPGVVIVELTTVTRADCARIASLRGPQPDLFAQLVVAAAPMSLPVFAAPEPGGRLSSAQFWAAQKARLDALRALAAFRRMGQTTRVASKR